MALTTSTPGRPDLRKRVIERLEHSIKMGGYRADEKLPTEYELAAEFQVSRPIIRDVLQILREKGLIYSRQGSGSYVKSHGYKSPLSFSPITTRSDVQHFYEFRMAIEPPAASLAATRLTESELIQLSLFLKDMQAPYVPIRSKTDAQYQFHASIARASGNSFFNTAIIALNGHISSFPGFDSQALLEKGANEAVVFEEHTRIYESLRIRDQDGAEEAMKLHLNNSLSRFLTTISL